ncbi:hypothetical protein BDM02DRAFT_2008952 [Thelephora ganbajun]|uniref:Uncharacterized protein n=1 Tax=Thelephora ganbajun TaxID=370292 RepID=A0ACB6YZN3_THEGA|nr:hypothetical protein BDM02DRAFT_2008952 [Thelephora ganbajun]
MPALVRVQQVDDHSVSVSTSTGIKVNVGQITEDHRANFGHSPGYSAAFDSTIKPPPPPSNDSAFSTNEDEQCEHPTPIIDAGYKTDTVCTAAAFCFILLARSRFGGS